MEQMRQNQEGLREELEIEIIFEEGRRKELENRHSQFIKQLDFQIATRIVNLKLNLDQPEKAVFAGQTEECKRCEERDQLLDENDPHVFAMVKKASMLGSPSRFKGKRETLPNVARGTSLEIANSRPANQQMANTNYDRGFNLTKTQLQGGAGISDDGDFFNCMVVLQPSV